MTEETLAPGRPTPRADLSVAPAVLSLAAFAAMFPGISGVWGKAFTSACAEFAIDTRVRQAAFFANIAHESAGLTKLEESFAHSPERLRKVFPSKFRTLESAAECVKRGPEAIANRVYGLWMGNGSEASGDGWRYRARGPIGLTGANNYKHFGAKFDLPLWSKPDLALLPQNGARIAGLFWQEAGCNALIDAGDFDGVCDKINKGRKTPEFGDSNGFEDRVRWRNALTAILEVAA